MSIDGFVIGTTWADVVPAGGGIVTRTFYVATNGNDSYTTAQATNLATPWRTIQKAASVMQAGDTCLIRSGIYRETVTPANSGVSNSPITFAPYAGESVVVSGADVITPSWSAYSNSIYVASTGLSFRQLFVDGVMMNESRWPNAQTDNLLQAHRSKVVVGDTSNVTLVDTNLPNVNLAGAKLHVFPGQNVGGEYAAFTRTISSYDSAAKKLYWSPGWQQSAGYYLTAGNPYYLYGALSLLDIPTEWYLDSGAGNLYLWTPDGASPAAHRVEIKARASAFVLDNRSYITLSNLYVFAAGVSMANTINCVVDNCHLRYVQHDTTADWSSGTIAAACAVSGSGSASSCGTSSTAMSATGSK
jgi:hypothetical protein